MTGILLVALLVAGGCGGQSPSAAAPVPACRTLAVGVAHRQLPASTTPTAGFTLPAASHPVGLVAGRDGSSVWVVANGTDRVLHLDAGGSATEYTLPASGQGLRPALGGDGSVWLPEQYRGAVAVIAPDGSARECALPGRNREAAAVAVAGDGAVWITEGRGNRIDRFAAGKFTEFVLPGPERQLAEILPAAGGGAWFSELGGSGLGHVSAGGQVDEIPLGEPGSSIGLLAGERDAVWVAVFGGDRVTRVGADRSLTNLPARAGAKPQSLALGLDGSVWLTESGLDRLARIRNGAIEEAVATGPWPDHLVVTADGWAWFTEYNGDRVGRVRLP